jgi:hypothetical protein
MRSLVELYRYVDALRYRLADRFERWLTHE